MAEPEIRPLRADVDRRARRRELPHGPIRWTLCRESSRRWLGSDGLVRRRRPFGWDHGVLRRLCGSRRRFLLGARIHDGSAVRPHFGPGQMGLQHGRDVDGASRNPIRWRRGHSLCGLERQGAALDVWRCRWRRLASGVETRSVPGAGAGAPAGGCLHDRKRDERSGAHRLSRRLGLCDRRG